MARVSLPADAGMPLHAAFAQYAPEIGSVAENYSLIVYQKSKLTLRELEAARYRVAQINGCVVCKGTRGGRDLPGYIEGRGGSLAESPVVRGPAPGEDFYEAVDQWRTSSLFSERERIAIDMAERMSERPQSMHGDETFWSNVKAHYTDEQLVDLCLAIGSWIALGRITHTLELDNICLVDLAAAA